MPYIIAGLNFQGIEPVFLGPFDTEHEASVFMHEFYSPKGDHYVGLPEGKDAFHVYFIRPPFDGWKRVEADAWRQRELARMSS